MSDRIKYQYHLIREYHKAGVNARIREYTATAGDDPQVIDRFTVFALGQEWQAWTCDTTLEKKRVARRAFAGSLK